MRLWVSVCGELWRDPVDCELALCDLLVKYYTHKNSAKERTAMTRDDIERELIEILGTLTEDELKDILERLNA